MTTFRSTMNAPLTEAESARILEKWYLLESICHFPTDDIEPLEMLDMCTDLIGAIWEVRRAIDDGWHAANRRQFPDPVHKPRVHPSRRLAILNNLTDEQVDALVQAINSGEFK